MYQQGKIMRRLLLGRSNEPSGSNDGNAGVTSAAGSHTYRPSASQDVEFVAHKPIACLDRSGDGQFAVLGGRYILKTVQFDGLSIKEGVDVRACITAQSSRKSSASATTADQLSIRDVKWATSQGGSPYIFTACSNGKIFRYDVTRLGSETPGGDGIDVLQAREDTRQVNTLDINPHRNNFMLSGGQEGVVRCYDMRLSAATQNGALSYRPLDPFRCNTEAITDVKWSPKDGIVFACATESGAVLKWDLRNHQAPLLRINAHDTSKGASSISWHPDGDHLVSAGLDNRVCVWDVSKDAPKKQRPKHTISAPAPVSDVAWRPALWSATARGRRAAQIAVAYDDGGTSNKHGIRAVHIWDLARPTMPYKEIDRFESSPSALLWHDQDLLWTVGSDGLLTQCDVAYAPKVIDRQPVSIIDFSPRGDVMMFLEQRAQPPRPRPAILPQDMLQTSSYSSSPTGQKLSMSRSDSEDDVVGSFLGPRKRVGRKRRPSTRSTYTYSTTPPSGHGGDDVVLPLDEAIGVTGIFRPQQVMAVGRVPASSKANVNHFLTVQYLEALEKGLSCIPGKEGSKLLNERIAIIMEHYAMVTESVGQFRLAQTWRVLAYAVDLLLTRRAQYHLETRLNRRKKIKSPHLKAKFETRLSLLALEHSTQNQPPMKLVSHPSAETVQHKPRLFAVDKNSESNATTPLAQPVVDPSQGKQASTDKSPSPSKETGDFELPPALRQERPKLSERLDSAPLSVISQGSQVSSTEGYDFYDLSAIKTLPMPIKAPGQKELSGQPSVGRHDSNESLAQMFSYSENQQNTDAGKPIARVDSNISEGEYASRIRGKEIRTSPDKKTSPPLSVPKGGDSGSLGDIFMISQTPDDGEASQGKAQIKPVEPTARQRQTANDSEASRETSQMNLVEPPKLSDTRREQGAVPQAELIAPRVRADPPPQKESSTRSTSRPEDAESSTVIETDFLPWPDDPPYPFRGPPPPFRPYDLISRSIAFEAQRSSVNATAMVLLLKPLLPDGIVDSYQAAAILRHHHNRLMGQKLFIEAALMRNLCVRDWPVGLGFWGENYPAVFGPAQDARRVAVGFKCAACKKPRDTDGAGPEAIWKCESCRSVVAPCAICGHRQATSASLLPTPIIDAMRNGSSRSEAPLSTWWYCPGCAHGGHATCLQSWHAPILPTRQSSSSSSNGIPVLQDGTCPERYSDGCCPMDGCGHACLPGKWQKESGTTQNEELGRAVREQTRGSVSSLKSMGMERRAVDPVHGSAPSVIGGVRSDALEAPPSRAVEGVREALSMSGISAGGGPDAEQRAGRAGGIRSVLSSSPKAFAGGSGHGHGYADGGRVERSERERRKSVKFAGATEERR